MLLVTGRPEAHRLEHCSAPDGVRIHYRAWRPAAPRAALVYLHGQGEHSGAFTAMGDRLAAAELAVYAPDQRGFGLSAEPRGDIDSFEPFIDDALHMVDRAAAAHPGLPVFLLGLSMGGHIALRAAARQHPALAGVAALAPGFQTHRTDPLFVLRLIWYALVRPAARLPTVVAHGSSTQNAAHLQRVTADDSYVLTYTARYYLAFWRSARRAAAEMARISVPTLVLQAGAERVISNAAARRLLARLTVADRELHVLPGVWHNMPVEPAMPAVAERIAAWIERRLPAGA